MKVNVLMVLVIFVLFWLVVVFRVVVIKIIWLDVLVCEFVFVENNFDDNFFVIFGGVLDLCMIGVNCWIGLKYIGFGIIYQQSFGYIDNGYNIGFNVNWKFDMWLENLLVLYFLIGLCCINWYVGCDMVISLILLQIIDVSGFYGVMVISGGVKWMYGMMLDVFY